MFKDLAIDAISHSQLAAAQQNTFNGPKLDRPKIEVGVSMEDWNIFERRWAVFRSGSNIADASASVQLSNAFVHLLHQ